MTPAAPQVATTTSFGFSTVLVVAACVSLPAWILVRRRPFADTAAA